MALKSGKLISGGEPSSLNLSVIVRDAHELEYRGYSLVRIVDGVW